jgi:hypothetical protein
MPTWRQGVTVGEWRQITGTALAAVPITVQTYPAIGQFGPAAKVAAWTGFAVDTRDSSIYSVANGGHMDYAGNEINRIRLSDATPRWSEPRPATPTSQVVMNASHYADGRPTSRHTYYGTVVNESRNRAMVFSGARWGDGASLFNLDGFNLASNDWDSARTYPDAPSSYVGSANGQATVGHRATGDVYAFANYNVLRWSNASNSWSRLLANAPMYGQYAASAVDTRRNRIFVVGGNGDDHAIYDIASNTAQNVTLTGPNAGALSGDGNGMVYDPNLDAYLLRTAGAGSTVYRINAQTFSVDTLPTTAGSGVPAAANGVWTRFLYLPQLKGIAYFPTYDGNFWFLRTN